MTDSTNTKKPSGIPAWPWLHQQETTTMILELKRPEPPSQPPKVPTLKDRFGDDDWLLKMCAEWRTARAQQQKNWAEYDLVTGWGLLWDDGIKKIDLTPLDRMQELELNLATCEPGSVLLARELLRMCVTILAFKNEDPDGTLAQGPVLEIVRNVLKSLEFVDGEMQIGDPLRAGRARKRRAKAVQS